MCIRLAPIAAALVLAITPLSAAAQKDSKEPERPKLPAGADTNDPRAYYLAGERLLMSNPRRLARYLDGDRRTLRSEEVSRIDSLHLRALMTNPFLYRKYERQMMTAYVIESVNGGSGADRLSPPEIAHIWDSYLMRAPAAVKGWAAYADGRFDDALKRYAEALSTTKRKAYLRTERGRIFQMTGALDSALVMLQLAAEELRKQDNEELVFLYDSKALLEFSIGKIHESRDQREEAREAYGRALQEDLSFYPAHVALSGLALMAGDTTAVVSEMELATELRPNDPVIRVIYGYALQQLGRREAAITQLERAIATEPLFARPHFILAELHEQGGDRASALRHYEQFVARAAKTAPDHDAAVAKVAQIKSAGITQ